MKCTEEKKWCRAEECRAGAGLAAGAGAGAEVRGAEMGVQRC